MVRDRLIHFVIKYMRTCRSFLTSPLLTSVINSIYLLLVKLDTLNKKWLIYFMMLLTQLILVSIFWSINDKLRSMLCFQALTPYMQSPAGDFSSNKSFGRVLGPALGDHNQGNFSINLWRNAFQDAFQRLCPLRAGGHECGCLPVLARMVCFFYYSLGSLKCSLSLLCRIE